jgi:hypothetical protein
VGVAVTVAAVVVAMASKFEGACLIGNAFPLLSLDKNDSNGELLLMIMPLCPLSRLDNMPITQMIIIVGDCDGNGGEGNKGGRGDACLRHCSDADGHPVCGQWWAGRQQWFCGNPNAVKIGSPIKLKSKTLIYRCLTRYYSSVWNVD